MKAVLLVVAFSFVILSQANSALAGCFSEMHDVKKRGQAEYFVPKECVFPDIGLVDFVTQLKYDEMCRSVSLDCGTGEGRCGGDSECFDFLKDLGWKITSSYRDKQTVTLMNSEISAPCMCSGIVYILDAPEEEEAEPKSKEDIALFKTYSDLKSQISSDRFAELRKQARTSILSQQYRDKKRDSVEFENVMMGVMAGLMQTEIDKKRKQGK